MQFFSLQIYPRFLLLLFYSFSLFNFFLSIFFISAYLRLGELELERGGIETASKMFHMALEVNPNSYGALSLLGDVYARLGNLGEAQRFYEKILKEIDSRDPRTLLAMGSLYFDDSAIERDRDKVLFCFVLLLLLIAFSLCGYDVALLLSALLLLPLLSHLFLFR